MKLKYTISSFESAEIAEFRVRDLDSKIKKKTEKATKKILSEYITYDIEITDEGIYANDLDVLNKYSQLSTYEIYNGVLIIDFIEYMNIYIPERLLTDEVFKSELLAKLEFHKANNEGKLDVQKEISDDESKQSKENASDSNRFNDEGSKSNSNSAMHEGTSFNTDSDFEEISFKTVTSKAIFSKLQASAMVYKSSFAYGIFFLVLFVILIRTTILLKVFSMIYPPNFFIFSSFRFAYLIIFMACIITFSISSNIEKKFKTRKLENRFISYLTLTKTKLKLKVDDKNIKKEVVYDLSTITKFIVSENIYTFYYKKGKKYKLLLVENTHFDIEKRKIFEDKMKEITIKNNLENEFDRKSIKRNKIKKAFIILNTLLFIGIFVAYFITPTIIKNYMPKTNKNIITAKNNYNKKVLEAEQKRLEEIANMPESEKVEIFKGIFYLIQEGNESQKEHDNFNKEFNEKTGNIFAPKHKEN